MPAFRRAQIGVPRALGLTVAYATRTVSSNQSSKLVRLTPYTGSLRGIVIIQTQTDALLEQGR